MNPEAHKEITPMAKQVLCNECRYWQGRKCHRHAPRALTVRESYEKSKVVQSLETRTSTYWPVTDQNDFCGEGEAKAKAK